MKKRHPPKLASLILIGLTLLSVSELLMAGTGGSSEFGNIYTLLT